MAIRNINNIQNHEDFKNVENKYILESLANLGQRYGIKGDSIKNGTLSLYNFFHDKGIVNIDAINDKIVVLKKIEESSYSLYLVNKDEISHPIFTISLNDKSKEDFIESIEGSDISINYNSIHFKVTDTYYEYFCKQTFNTKNKVSYILERVNKNTNTLEYGLRVYRGHGINTFPTSEDGTEHYLITELILQDPDTELYTLNIYSSIIDIANFESSTDEDSYWFYNGGDGFLETIDIDSSSRESAINEYGIYLGGGDIYYNNIDFSGTNLNDFERNFPGIHTLLYNYTYDIKLLYIGAKERYSTNTYGDVNSIYSQILISLFNKITDISSTGIKPLEIYIPLTLSDTDSSDTEFFGIRYMCNSNSENEIYFSTQDIQVKYVYETIDSDWFIHNINSSRDYIVVHTDKSDRVSFFNFEVKKDDDNPELTVGINTTLKSTLPYIDENGFWVLNDVPTTIYARGKNAGNPNIIIVESKKVDKHIDYTILAGAKKEELNKIVNWEPRQAYIEPLEKINLDTLTFKTEYDYFILDAAIPNLDTIDERNKSEYLSFLENAIIINICDISCIEVNNNYNTNNINYTLEDLYEIYGVNGIITTIWAINKETGLFDYLRKRENPIAAADFNYISNINNLIQYVVKNTEPVHPDNYYFSYLVFDSTYSTLKNNTSETKTYIYPNIINKISSQYSVTNYNNDLNFTPKFNDLIIRSDNDRIIDSLNQSGNLRYFNTTYNTSGNDNANIVTNSLYVYYNENGQLSRYNEYIPNYNVPSLDLGEVLTRNETLINRLNIISFDRFGTAYLSYVGTSFENDKNVFRIGTSKTNINMGTDTLIYSTERDNFETQSKVSVEFDNIELTGDTDIDQNLYVKNNIVSNGVIWNRIDSNLYTSEIIANTSYYTTIFTPSSRYIYEISDNMSDSNTKSGIVRFGKDSLPQTDSSKSDTSVFLSYSVYKYSIDKNKLYTINTIYNSNINGLLYFGDGIYIPALLDKIGLSSYISINADYTKIATSMIEVSSNMDVVKHNNNPIILLSSATNLYPDKYIYTRRNYYDSIIGDQNDTQVQSITNFTYSIFTGNPLKITYYIGASRLHLHIEELYSKDKIMTDEKVKIEYFS